MAKRRVFIIAHNPEPDSRLPYLLWIPVGQGLVLKSRETWPVTARVYCHPFDGPWPEEAQVVEEVPVRVCRRRGPAIDLVLDRSRNTRSQFVFTQLRGRPAIFWQTHRAARNARPGVRIPKRRVREARGLTIEIDTRERYPYRFADRSVYTARAPLRVGDYAGRALGEAAVAAVERKSLDNFVTSLVDGGLAFTMAELAALPAGAVVVEARYSRLFGLEYVSRAWILELVGRLQVRYREVPIVFADSRKLAEEWTYRFLAAALAELGS